MSFKPLAQMRAYPRRKIAAALALVAVGGVLGLAAVKIKHMINVPELKRQVAIWRQGGGGYVKARLDKEGQAVAPAGLLGRSIDTSRLPLNLREVPLIGADGFPAGSGGAVAKIGDRLLVLDRLGGIYVVDKDKPHRLDYGTFPSNLAEYIKSAPGSIDSLLFFRTHHILYDPRRSLLYVTLERFNPASRKLRFVLASLPIDPVTLEKRGDWRTLFESGDLTHAPEGFGGGGAMALSDDTLYFAIGDWSTEAVPDKQSQLVAQDPASAFGKTFGLDLASGKVTMRSLGHRNPEGMVLTADRQLLELEHGPEGGDELNRIEPGANYGWPYTVYGVEYGTFTWPIALKPPAGAKFTDALYAFVPSIGSSSLIQVDRFSDRWAGDLLVSSLKAQSLFRLRLVEGRVIYSEPIWVGTRIRDLVEMDGRIVLLTDTPSLIYMEIDQPRMAANSHSSKDLDSALTTCMACHHLGPTNPTQTAPSLTNIVGRPIASDDFANYSAGLKAKGGRWDKEAIVRFIRNPGGFAPGSVMPAQNLTEEQARHIVEVLAN